MSIKITIGCVSVFGVKMNRNLMKSLQCVWVILVTVSCAIDVDITDYTEVTLPGKNVDRDQAA